MENIAEILESLEKQHGIKILYAAESGSRAWGMESDDSDYDIRFIYIHRSTKSYFSLIQPSKSIDGFSEDRLYDWQGWELSKAVNHLRDSNPSIVEWVHSPVVYKDIHEPLSFAEWSRKLLQDDHLVGVLLKHYFSMAKKNYLGNIEGKNEVNVKKYMYVIRPAAMMQWLFQANRSQCVIKMNCLELFDEIRPFIGEDVYGSIVELTRKKQGMHEGDLQSRIPIVDDWIRTSISPQTHAMIEDIIRERQEKRSVEDFDTIIHLFHNL